MDSINNNSDFGFDISNKSIEAFENGDFFKAVMLQLEVVEEAIKIMIRGRGRHLGLSNTKIHKLADEGDLETRINNLKELCGSDFNYLCENLQDWRERRNRLIHRKHTFKDDEELNDFARETWLIGTFIIYNFVDSIANIPLEDL